MTSDWEGEGPFLTQDVIHSVSHQIGEELPEGLETFYLVHNGGWSSALRGDETNPIHGYVPIGQWDNDVQALYRSLVVEDDRIRGLFPFAYDSVSDVFLVSLREEDAGDVYHYAPATRRLERLGRDLRSCLPADAQGGLTPREYWNRRYSQRPLMWSGAVNRSLARALNDVTPGRALDLGCGEGADVIWLATQGWQVTGIDLSEVAIDRAREAATAAGLAGTQAKFVAGDILEWFESGDPGEFDLVAGSFFHARVELPRTQILRRAAEHVAPGGLFLTIAHAQFPPKRNVELHPDGIKEFTVASEISTLAPDPHAWEQLVADVWPREVNDDEGHTHVLEDVVVLLRRK